MRTRVLVAALAALVGGGVVVAAPAGATPTQTPTISASFGSPSVAHDTETTLSFTIYNPNPPTATTPTFGFTTTLPADNGAATMQIPQSANVNDTCGGSFQNTATTVTYTGGSADPQSICVVSFNVIAIDPGTWEDAVQLSASNGGASQNVADLTIVAGPQSHLDFSTIQFGGPRSVRLGDTVPLSVTIANPNDTVALSGVGFSDPIPDGFKVAATPGASQTCGGGTITADAGSGTFSLIGGALDDDGGASPTCTWTVHVTAVKAGFWSDSLGAVSSTEGGDGGLVQDATISVLTDGPRVMWSNASAANQAGSFGYTELNGTGAGDLLNAGANKYNAVGFALDLAHSTIYYIAGMNSADTAGEVYHAPLDGADNSIKIETNTSGLYTGMGLDESAQRLYWYDGSHAFSDTDLTTLQNHGVDVAGHDGATGGFVIDNALGRIYWMNDSEVQSANLDGSTPHTIATELTAHIADPVGIAVDAAAGRVYWVNSADQTIDWVSIDGTQTGGLNTTGATVDEPQAIAIDPVKHRVYWTNLGGDSISWAATDGSGGGTVDTEGSVVDKPTNIALFEPPTASSPPTVTGNEAVGSTMHCTSHWAPDLTESNLYRSPQSVATRWLRNGSVIADATSTTHQATTSGSYSCRQTATNDTGSATSTSTSHSIYQAPTTGRITVQVSGRTATARLTSHGKRSGFQCRLSSARAVGVWTRCSSPHKIRGLKPGHYLLQVRATGPGGVDPTPARATFHVKKV